MRTHWAATAASPAMYYTMFEIASSGPPKSCVRVATLRRVPFTLRYLVCAPHTAAQLPNLLHRRVCVTLAFDLFRPRYISLVWRAYIHSVPDHERVTQAHTRIHIYLNAHTHTAVRWLPTKCRWNTIGHTSADIKAETNSTGACLCECTTTRNPDRTQVGRLSENKRSLTYVYVFMRFSRAVNSLFSSWRDNTYCFRIYRFVR